MKTVENKSENVIVITKRLSKYTSDQLFKKLNSSTNADELAVVKELLTKRGKLTAPKEEVTNEVSAEAKKVDKLVKKATDLKKIKLEIMPIVLPAEETTETQIVNENIEVKSEIIELTVEQIIDAIYAMNNIAHNAALCGLFPEDGVDDYNLLPAETVDAVRKLYAEILNPTPKSTKKAAVKTAKVKVEKAEGAIITEDSGIKINDTVTFDFSKTSSIISGVVKKIFFYKKANKNYLYIKDANGHIYYKEPSKVSKV